MQPVVNLSLGHSIGSNLLVILARGVEPLELPEQMYTLNIRSVVIDLVL